MRKVRCFIILCVLMTSLMSAYASEDLIKTTQIDARIKIGELKHSKFCI